MCNNVIFNGDNVNNIIEFVIRNVCLEYELLFCKEQKKFIVFGVDSDDEDYVLFKRVKKRNYLKFK